MGWFSNSKKSTNDLIVTALNKSLAVIEFEPSGTIITANNNFLDVMGYPLEEIQGQHHSMFVSKQEVQSTEYKNFWQSLKGGDFIANEFKRISKSGKEVWIQATYNPVQDEHGNVIKVVKLASDITAQKMITIEAAGKIAAISKSQAVIEFALDGSILAANDNFLQTFGYQLEEIVGRHHRILIEPEVAKSEQYQQFWQKLGRGEFDSGEYLRIAKDGSEVWIQASYNPIFDLSGKPYKVVKYAIDITAQKELERESKRDADLSSALNICQTNITIADNDLKVVFANQQVMQMFQHREQTLQSVLSGFSVTQLLGSSIETLHCNPAQLRQQLLALQEPCQSEFSLAGIIFNITMTPWVNRKNKRLGTIIEWQDITDRVSKAEAEKREAQENLRVRRALDCVATNTMIANADNNIIYMNEAILTMLQAAEQDLRKELNNFNSNDLLGKNINVLYKEAAQQENTLAQLRSVYSTEMLIGGRTFGLIANPIFTPDDARIGTVIEWQDRTAEVAIEKEIANLVSSARKGDLNARVEEQGKEDFYLRLAKGLNGLVSIVDDAVTDTGNMLDALANGDLSKRIEQEYQGAFERLKRDANTTADKLTEVINRINTSAILVASGADEISQGNADLSQRTEEQASSLEETASSMEEMTSTVRQNADNAKVVNELAEETRDKAQQGGDVVNRAVISMSAINQSSKKIADIISVIDEIAFQTNLLALNAAVEAARAGEQGRGFAVVAGEVRNLAQRSAGAAKEIKELIRDSIGKVEDGTVLVNESGATLKEIVTAVQKVTEMISDIADASIEQSAGIEQVNKAISQMDEMTQQNAALVEQASAASESMSEQANDMTRLLSFFSLSQQNTAINDVSVTPAAVPIRSSISGKRGNNFADTADKWEEF